MPDPWEYWTDAEWAKNDYYAELGLLLGVPQTVIEKTYLELSKIYHPDRSKQHAAKMARINNAHDVLKDPDLKQRYDLALRTHKSRMASARPSGPSESPPAVYNPVIAVDKDSFDLTVTEGEKAILSFTVRHLSGELPPHWSLVYDNANGLLMDDATLTMNPEDRFPTRVTIELPTDTLGEFEESFDLQVVEV